ncbi:hypothetical protein [Streptomyces sp. NPDC051286]|uniref:hypothetical protein n=1 Tax=Streptomyces sp. NPDC051286 TaxID=3365647 RepID=UPI0037BB765E
MTLVQVERPGRRPDTAKIIPTVTVKSPTKVLLMPFQPPEPISVQLPCPATGTGVRTGLAALHLGADEIALAVLVHVTDSRGHHGPRIPDRPAGLTLTWSAVSRTWQARHLFQQHGHHSEPLPVRLIDPRELARYVMNATSTTS